MEIVKKSYQVVTARMSLDANEQNLFTLLVRELKLSATDFRERQIRESKIENLPISDDIPINADDLPSVFHFTLSELSEVMGVTDSALSQTLEVTTKKMMQRVITWSLENGGYEMEQLLGPSKYQKGKGILSMSLHPRTKSAILEETRGVSIIDFRFSLRLKGGYEKRILDMISTFKNKRDFEVEFNAFQDMMGASVNDYARGLKGFRTTVLDGPLKRIFKESDGAWIPYDEKKRGYELIKVGRIVKKVVFKVKYNDPDSIKNISKNEQLERKKLEQQSDAMVAELLQMEESLLATQQIDSFTKIMIFGYKAAAKECAYTIPDHVSEKIIDLTN